jgi:hypothetical protein
MLIFWVHIVSAIVILLAGAIVLIRSKPVRFRSAFIVCWAAQILLSLPAGIYQAVFSWPGITLGNPSERFFVPLVGWPFNAGGWTVRWLFEATVEPLEFLVGHRSSVVFSNMRYYWLLLFIQGTFIAAAIARLHVKGKLNRAIVIALVVAFLLNSLLNVQWFWAGT